MSYQDRIEAERRWYQDYRADLVDADDASAIAYEADAELAKLSEDNHAKDARIKELEAEVVTLALCEQEHVLLAPGRTYRFEAVPGCKVCEKLQEQLDR